jgi:hypothetical protein
MRLCMFTVAVCALLAATTSYAHGPQIQTTLDNGNIVTREIVDEANYDTVLSPAKTVYVMPLAEYLGVWRAQPDSSLLPDNTPEFVGWPGFAYGYGYNATTNPAPFPLGSKFVLGITAGLKSWDSASFVDAGVTEAEAYRGSSAAPSALARTSDAGPFQSLMFPGGTGIAFTAEGGDTHNTVNYRMVGDGASITSPLADGVYLLSMQLTSTSTSVAASEPFYFILEKNVTDNDLIAAVNGFTASQGISPSLVQYTSNVPEPGALMLVVAGAIGTLLSRGRRSPRS